MSVNVKCNFCDKPAEKLQGYYVCRNCGAVCWSGDVSSEHKAQLIAGYINQVRSTLIEHKDFISAIDKKRIMGNELSTEEKVDINNLTEFNVVRLELAAYLENTDSLNGIKCRNALYRLLELSSWIDGFLIKLASQHIDMRKSTP